MTKMTYVSALSAILSGAEMTSEIQEKLEALRASLEKRAAAPHSTKPSKAQREAAQFAEDVYELLKVSHEAMRCGEIAKALEVSGQKVSAALSKLVKAGRIVKTQGEKKVALFALPTDEDEAE